MSVAEPHVAHLRSPATDATPGAERGALPWVEAELSGWGRQPVERCRLLHADREQDLAVVLSDPKAAPTLIPRGLGRSYGDAAQNPEGVVDCNGLDRFLAFDPDSGVLECQAGVALREVLRVMLPRGWYLPVTPGTQYVTLGGAIAADVHGKNHHRVGSISSAVPWLDLLLPNGERVRCGPDQNARLFWATVGGMGLTGIITAAALRLKPVESAYVRSRHEKAPDLEAALQSFAEGDDGFEYSMAWIDCLAPGRSLGRSVLMRGDHARASEVRGDPFRLRRAQLLAVPIDLPSGLLNGFTMRAFNQLYYSAHRDGERIEYHEGFFHPLDFVGHWNRIYGRRGFIQYQAVLPLQEGERGLVRLLEEVQRFGTASFLAVLKVFGPGGSGLLSFPMEGYTLALDLPVHGAALDEVGRRLDAIVLDHGGRVYLAKDAVLDAERFAAMYPRLEEFREIRAEIDPGGRLSSSLARRVGLARA